MSINRTSTPPFSAKIHIGLKKGYSDELIPKEKILNDIQAYQNQLIEEKSVYLSASITDSVIVMSGQLEPHIIISFINYPRFPLDQSDLKTLVEDLAKHLMAIHHQNRIVIEYLDETVMLQQSEEIDHRIRKT